MNCRQIHKSQKGHWCFLDIVEPFLSYVFEDFFKRLILLTVNGKYMVAKKIKV